RVVAISWSYSGSRDLPMDMTNSGKREKGKGKREVGRGKREGRVSSPCFPLPFSLFPSLKERPLLGALRNRLAPAFVALQPGAAAHADGGGEAEFLLQRPDAAGEGVGVILAGGGACAEAAGVAVQQLGKLLGEVGQETGARRGAES